MKTKRKPSDDAFSKCVRAAAGYACQRCGKQFGKGDAGLHCSHNFSRRHRTIRWCKDNALALCFTCHDWFGGNPLDSGVWLESFIGPAMVEVLREKMNSKQKVSKIEEKEIAAHYRAELVKIEKALTEGQAAPIDFVSWQ